MNSQKQHDKRCNSQASKASRGQISRTTDEWLRLRRGDWKAGARRNTSTGHGAVQVCRRRARSGHCRCGAQGRRGVARRRDGREAIDGVDIHKTARGAGGGHSAEEDAGDDGCGQRGG